MPPCTREWYLDSLFAYGARSGDWMAELETADLSECTWLVNSFRLRMMNQKQLQAIGGRYQLLPGGIGILQADPRARMSWPQLDWTMAESYWWSTAEASR